METFIWLIAVIFGILHIILFFKIWEMTDHIKDIRNKYVLNKSYPRNQQNFKMLEYPIGSEVKHIKTNQNLIIKKFDSDLNSYVCYSKTDLFVGSFKAEELTKETKVEESTKETETSNKIFGAYGVLLCVIVTLIILMWIMSKLI
jgi:hypothetical protein